MHKGLSYDSFANAKYSFKGVEMTQSDLGLLTIGQTLREARESQKLNIETISAILKIREDHLTALEGDDFDYLPGSVYAIGFIRTYSKHLGLDASVLIERYKSNNTPAPKQDLDLDIDEDKEPLSDRVKISIGVVLVLFIFLLWLFLGGSDDGAINEVGVETVEQADAPIAAAPIAAAPVSEPPAQNIAEAPKAEPTANAAPQADVPPAQSARAPADVEVQEIPAARVEPAAPAQEAAEPRAPDVIEVQSRRRTWMRIESDAGQVLFSSIIDAGRSFRLPDGDNFVLATRDAGALEYVLNGEVIGAVGRRGQILTNRRLSRADIIELSR